MPALNRWLQRGQLDGELMSGLGHGWIDKISGLTARIGVDPIAEVNEPTDQIPGNTSTPFSIPIGGQDTGVINFLGDRDWFAVTLTAGEVYIFTLTGSGGAPLSDPYLVLYNSAGVQVAFNDDADWPNDLNSVLTFTPSVSGTYYLGAQAFDDSVTGGYTLTAAISTPLDSINWMQTMATTSIDVYFATTGQMFNGETALRDWTTAEVNAAMAALNTFAQFTALTFNRVFTPTGAEMVLTLAALEDGTLGYFQVGTPYGFFNPNAVGWDATGLQQGGYGFVTLIHELGHGLGLAHPHDTGGGSTIMPGVTGPFDSYGDHLLNQGVFTTMSYNDGWPSHPSASPASLSGLGWQGTPMALDIAMLQQFYGVNASAGSGATTYTLQSANYFYRAIWDVGGIDTIAYSGSANATIDLRAATIDYEVGGGGWVSYVSGVHGGFTIAAGVVIENATGGSGQDTLTGNSAANVLNGGAGHDTLFGQGGNDSLMGDLGNDTLNGGAGVDASVYTLTSGAATWLRNVSGSWTVTSAQGVDTVANIEFLDFDDRDVFLDRAQRTFSGNGTSDVLFRRADGIMASWEVTGTTINAASFLPTAGPEWSVLGTGDISGDGRDDVIWKRSDGLIYAWIMNGGSVSAAVGVTGVANIWTFLGVGDFNGDLTDDLAWQRNDGVVFTWTMQNSALQSASGVTGLSAEWQIAGLGDFNGDGRDDFLWRRSDNGQTVVWHMNGSSIQSSGFTSVQTGLDWAVVGVGDTNRDGYDDIILQRASDGMVAVWAMNGTTVLSNTQVAAANPAQWTIQGIGDYNGDGREDILWQRNDGLVYVWLMNGASIQSAGALSGIGPEWSII